MLLFQPGDRALGDILSDEIRADNYVRYKSISILVAYAKHSGVARLAPALEGFVAAGGTLSAAVGLDQGQTTIEALELLQQIGAAVSVFYDEDGNRTYHPKVYLFEGGAKHAWLAVGSSNLTAGGLYLNYEASTILTGKSARDAAANAQLRSVFDGTSKHAKALDPTLFQSLIDNGYILTEQRARERRATESDAARKKATLFPRSKQPALPEIDPKFKLSPTKKKVPPAPPAASPPVSSSGPVSPPAPPVRGFWKRLSKWDVSLTSSPGQMIIPMQFADLFPKVGASKATTGGAKQADVLFDVVYVDDTSAPVVVKNARLIKYVPGKSHPRQNIDLRFTFLDRGILQSLKAGDMLEFSSIGHPVTRMQVKRTPAAKVTATKRFGLIP